MSNHNKIHFTTRLSGVRNLTVNYYYEWECGYLRSENGLSPRGWVSGSISAARPCQLYSQYMGCTECIYLSFFPCLSFFHNFFFAHFECLPISLCGRLIFALLAYVRIFFIFFVLPSLSRSPSYPAIDFLFI